MSASVVSCDVHEVDPPVTRLKPMFVVTDPDVGYHDNPRLELVALARRFGMRGTVVDVGCGSGRFGERLLEEGIAEEVIGIELNSDAAASAQHRLSQVVVGDATDRHLLQQIPSTFDALVLADVLEHTAQPERVLKSFSTRLRPGGICLVSVPNVRHKSVLCDLVLRNEWRYAADGICDDTHLRFYTAKSALRLCRRTSLEVTAQYGLVSGRSGQIAKLLPAVTSFMAVQLVLVARPQR